MKITKQTKVSILGAGPGDPDLITLKGVKALKSADVILYDALVNTELLNWAPKAIKIFVGKRLGFKQYPQEEINQMLVEKAFEYGHVVRLKGGDPFVFGRGSEEMDFVRSFGIEVDIIPGISSVLAAAAHLEIPLTERKISEGFWVITGTRSDHKLSEEIKLAAQGNSTVVVLMGMSKLPKIQKIFQSLGKEKLPIAIIQNASSSKQKKVVGTIENIVEKVKLNNIKNPGVMIIGEVARQKTIKLDTIARKFSIPQLPKMKAL